MQTPDTGGRTLPGATLREPGTAAGPPGSVVAEISDVTEISGVTEISVVTEMKITPLSPTEWRVVDGLRPDDDENRILGFIQQVGESYEVTSLVRLRERTAFASFERAASSLNPRSVIA